MRTSKMHCALRQPEGHCGMTTRAQTGQISGSPLSLGVQIIHVSEHPTHLTRNQRCGGEQEVNVIRGALDLTAKQAIVGMTPIDKVCTARLSSNAQLQRLRRDSAAFGQRRSCACAAWAQHVPASNPSCSGVRGQRLICCILRGSSAAPPCFGTCMTMVTLSPRPYP